MLFAKIIDGVVENIAVADAPFAGHDVEVDSSVGKGDLWDGFVFTKAPQPPPEPSPTHETTMSKADFLELFTDAELEAFLDIDTLPTPAQRPMRVAIKKFDAAQEIDVTDARTITLVASLVALTVLTQERADVILLGKSV